MKAFKNEEIQKLYMDLGLVENDKVTVNNKINEGSLNNNLNTNFVALYENSKHAKQYYRV